MPVINVDILAKEVYPQTPEEHGYDAAKLATEMRFQLLYEGRSFCFETAFSHPSKIDFVAYGVYSSGYSLSKSSACCTTYQRRWT